MEGRAAVITGATPVTARTAMGTRLRDMYVVVPLANGRTVSTDNTSHGGGDLIGLIADRDVMDAVGPPATSVVASLDEPREPV